jgi:hypothetical protein
VKESVKKIHKVKCATRRNDRRENDGDSSSDFGEIQSNQNEDSIETEIAVNEVVKVLEKEGLYKFERKARGAQQKTVDYANNVVKHTAKFLVFVGGEELLNLPIISVLLVMSLFKIIIKRLHMSVVNNYCDFLSDRGISSSKQVS